MRHRLKIAGGKPDIHDATACAAVYHFSKGVPRLIDILCDSALVYGFAEEKAWVDVDMILSVVEGRKEGGLSVLTGHSGPIDRAKFSTEISVMSTEAAGEENPPNNQAREQRLINRSTSTLPPRWQGRRGV